MNADYLTADDFSFLFQEEDPIDGPVKAYLETFNERIIDSARRGEGKVSLDFTIDESELYYLNDACDTVKANGFQVKQSTREIAGEIITVRVLVSWEEQLKESMERLSLDS